MSISLPARRIPAGTPSPHTASSSYAFRSVNTHTAHDT